MASKIVDLFEQGPKPGLCSSQTTKRHLSAATQYWRHLTPITLYLILQSRSSTIPRLLSSSWSCTLLAGASQYYWWSSVHLDRSRHPHQILMDHRPQDKIRWLRSQQTQSCKSFAQTLVPSSYLWLSSPSSCYKAGRSTRRHFDL